MSCRASMSLLSLVSLAFLVAGVAACYVPARRASGVDPNVALRDYRVA